VAGLGKPESARRLRKGEAYRPYRLRYIGGVPRLIAFDHSKVNVAKIVGRRGETPSHGPLQLSSHYLFQRHFCRIYEPQEKGHVENAVNDTRQNFMVPLPVFENFVAFNASLEQKCQENFDKTSANQEKTIGALFEEEKSA
jgi:transposase